ncbi:MAG TPA: site-2 protease family protein [Candidatus Udaeobacter sp.]|jgi:Zn-dependent protease|nr:site-2 protease family protein [Candidatus Udaeobacter sp.]
MFEVVLALPVVVFSLAARECAHAVAAEWRGDRSAREAGRRTLDPRPHLDALGMLIVPGLLALAHAPVLVGWARPAPVDAARLRDPRRDRSRVALAGLLSNAALALGFAAAARLIPATGPLAIAHRMALIGVAVNCALTLFHLVPLPPLDGSWLLMRVLRLRHILLLHQFRVVGFILLSALLLSPFTAPALRSGMRAIAGLCLALFGGAPAAAEPAW